jgi:hypothetical protein
MMSLSMHGDYFSRYTFQAFTSYMSVIVSIQLDSSSSAWPACFRACLVSLARRDAAQLDFCGSFLSWPLNVRQFEAEACQSSTSRFSISKTWLSLRDPWLVRSAHPNSNAYFCLGIYLYRMVEVVLSSRKQGKSGTRPRRSSVLPTKRIGTGEDSYNFLIKENTFSRLIY